MSLLSPSPPCPSCHPPPPCTSCHPPHFLMSPSSLSHVTSFHHSFHIPLLHTTMCHTVPPGLPHLLSFSLDYHICFPHSLWLKSWSKTVAIFWHNAAETWIDIASATANKVKGCTGVCGLGNHLLSQHTELGDVTGGDSDLISSLCVLILVHERL